MILDGSDATIGATALSTARLVGQSFALKYSANKLPSADEPAPSAPLEVRTQVWYNPDFDSALLHDPRRDRHDSYPSSPPSSPPPP